MRKKALFIGLFIITLAGLSGLLVYQSVFPYKAVKSHTVSGVDYDIRAADQASFATKEFKETARSNIYRLETTMNFNAFSIGDADTLFETAPRDRGVRLILSKPSALTLTAGTKYAPGYKTYIISGTVALNKWHNFYLRISPSKRIIIRFDDGPIVDAPDTELVNEISDIRIGAGANATKRFDGEIRDASVSYELYAPNTLAQSPIMRVLEVLLFAANLIFLFILSGFEKAERESIAVKEATT